MATLTNKTKNTISNDYLTQENTDYLLLEDGSFIIINQGYSNKEKNATSLTNEAKN